jgi:hypothetical protein
MIMFGSFLPSLLVGFSTTNFTRAGEPTLLWNHFTQNPFRGDQAGGLDASRVTLTSSAVRETE